MKPNQLPVEEIALFCEQLAMLLKAGIPINEGLELMEEDGDDEKFNELLKTMREQLMDYDTFDKVLEDTGCFSKYMIHMVKIGLDSGKLDEVMELLARYYQREDEIRKSLKKVVIYPTILLTALGVVVWVLSIKVLPVFEEILNNLGIQVTGMAMGLMKLGEGMSKSFIVLLILALIASMIGFYQWQKVGTKSLLHQFLLKLKVYEKLETQRVMSAMSLMLASGVDSTYGMKMALELVTHEKVRGKMAQCLALMEEGETFTDGLEKTGALESKALRMLKIGSKSGYLDEMVQKVACHYEEEVEDRLLGLIAKVEPTIVILLAIIIGSVLLSVMVPLMSIMSAIG